MRRKAELFILFFFYFSKLWGNRTSVFIKKLQKHFGTLNMFLLFFDIGSVSGSCWGVYLTNQSVLLSWKKMLWYWTLTSSCKSRFPVSWIINFKQLCLFVCLIDILIKSSIFFKKVFIKKRKFSLLISSVFTDWTEILLPCKSFQNKILSVFLLRN